MVMRPFDRRRGEPRVRLSLRHVRLPLRHGSSFPSDTEGLRAITRIAPTRKECRRNGRITMRRYKEKEKTCLSGIWFYPHGTEKEQIFGSIESYFCYPGTFDAYHKVE